jgi:hypothetical protein
MQGSTKRILTEVGPIVKSGLAEVLPMEPSDDSDRKSSRINWKVCLRVFLAVVLFGVLTLFGYTVKHHWNDANFVGFLVAWIPFALSIMFAFIPDAAMKMRWRIIWRVGVILGGLFYSVLLWHNQTLAADAAREDQRNLLAAAIASANQHSDTQIGTLRGDIKNQVQGVESDLENKLGSTISQSTSSLSESIGKVGKPEPVEKVKVDFSLWPIGGEDSPTLTNRVAPEKDGTFIVDITYHNISTVSATQMDIWIQACDACEFVGDPPGFKKPAGDNEHIRHQQIAILNSRTWMEKFSVHVRVTEPANPFFELGFTYACPQCVVRPKMQVLRLYIARPQ